MTTRRLELTLTTGRTCEVDASEEDGFELERWARDAHGEWFRTREGDVVNPAHVVAARVVALPRRPRDLPPAAPIR